MGDDWKRKIREALQDEFPAYLHELDPPRKVPFAGYPNILISYLNFFDWLGGEPSLQWEGYDRGLIYGLRVDVFSYLSQMRTHQDEVTGVLTYIHDKSETGQALLRELRSTGSTVTILPYVYWRKYGYRAFTSTRAQDAIYATDPSCRSANGLGTGSAALLFYSAHMWAKLRRSAITRGPGTRADEYLFHELVHASRITGGKTCATPVSPNYDNQEEYLAVVLTNIYSSEKGYELLGEYHGGKVLTEADAKRFLDNPQGVNMPPRVLIEQFKSQQGSFYDELAHIGPEAWFNPVRWYSEEEEGT